jgi:hypothetical protein
MKKSIKHLVLLLALALVFDAGVVLAQTGSEKEQAEASVEAIYFHNHRRCGWCVNLEKSSREAVEELYAEELKSGKVKFVAANLQQADGAELAKKYQISSVSFIVANGDESINLTNAGMRGRTDPDSYKKAIKEAVDSYLSN